MSASLSREILFGKVVQINKIGLKQIPCALVRCQENVFSSYIKKYFAESKDYWALDSKSVSQVGDHVLIRIAEQAERPTSSVMHNVDRVIFKFGNLIDPITKKRVLNGLQFEDELVSKANLVEEVVEEPFKE
uniref:Ribosomal protein S17 n=1 Tax=Panagrolaimus sp. JU765 TaxID=591449 RepID=A0AC34RHA2_9BILA